MIDDLLSALKRLVLIVVGAVIAIPVAALISLNTHKTPLYLNFSPVADRVTSPDFIAPLWGVMLSAFIIGAAAGAGFIYFVYVRTSVPSPAGKS